MVEQFTPFTRQILDDLKKGAPLMKEIDKGLENAEAKNEDPQVARILRRTRKKHKELVDLFDEAFARESRAERVKVYLKRKRR